MYQQYDEIIAMLVAMIRDPEKWTYHNPPDSPSPYLPLVNLPLVNHPEFDREISLYERSYVFYRRDEDAECRCIRCYQRGHVIESAIVSQKLARRKAFGNND